MRAAFHRGYVANLAGAERFELSSPGLESGSLAVSLRPYFQRPMKNPA